MWLRRVFLGVCILCVTGCATYTGAGSDTWYKDRLAELEGAKQRNEITSAEYFAIKNDIDRIRMDYLNGEPSYWPPYPSWEFRYDHHHH